MSWHTSQKVSPAIGHINSVTIGFVTVVFIVEMVGSLHKLPILLSLIPHVSSTGPQIDNFRTSISVLLLTSTFVTIISITNAWGTANYTFASQVTKRTFVTYPYYGCRSYVRIAHRTSSVTLFAEPAHCNSRLLHTWL